MTSSQSTTMSKDSTKENKPASFKSIISVLKPIRDWLKTSPSKKQPLPRSQTPIVFNGRINQVQNNNFRANQPNRQSLHQPRHYQHQSNQYQYHHQPQHYFHQPHHNQQQYIHQQHQHPRQKQNQPQNRPQPYQTSINNQTPMFFDGQINGLHVQNNHSFHYQSQQHLLPRNRTPIVFDGDLMNGGYHQVLQQANAHAINYQNSGMSLVQAGPTVMLASGNIAALGDNPPPSQIPINSCLIPSSQISAVLIPPPKPRRTLPAHYSMVHYGHNQG